MTTDDQKLRNRLRDLPTGYLLDLLVDGTALETAHIHDTLLERGLEPDEIAGMVRRRANSNFPHGYILWDAARTFVLISTLLVIAFNMLAYYHLLHGHSPFRGGLLLISAIGMIFGFFVGFKLSTHLYQGSRHHLHCGFPLPVGIVDLRTGQEEAKPKAQMLLSMAGNALVGLTLVLFPLMLACYFLNQ